MKNALSDIQVDIIDYVKIDKKLLEDDNIPLENELQLEMEIKNNQFN